jgi:hypothetical protein
MAGAETDVCCAAVWMRPAAVRDAIPSQPHSPEISFVFGPGLVPAARTR